MYKNLLVPIVFDESRDIEAAFLAARRLAEDSAAFTVLHVMETLPAYAAAEIPEAVLDRSRNDAQDELSRLADGLPGAEATLVEGHAGRSITDYATENDIDCIVMASHRPRGIRDFFIGSTADWVVRHAGCSVHVIRS